MKRWTPEKIKSRCNSLRCTQLWQSSLWPGWRSQMWSCIWVRGAGSVCEQHLCDLGFTQPWRTLAFPVAALHPLASDLWDLICCCQLPLICEQAGMSLGERAGRWQRGCLKERLHTSTLWKTKRIIFHRSSIISTMPGHLVGRKTANWWQPRNKQLKRFLFFFPYLQVEIIKEGCEEGKVVSLACGISHCWQSIDWNVKGRELAAHNRNNTGAFIFTQTWK